MRILDVHIDGFGHFADVGLGPFKQPLTVFFGPNEAGKSTYLEFIRTVLFGFPFRKGRDHYPPLKGGRHGGRITVVDGEGNPYVVERHQGRGVGPVVVTNSEGGTLDEATLARLLGHHGKDVFESVFAFTLEELHSDALLRDESVNSQIYSAGMGATNLPAALKQLRTDKNRLFLKGGRIHKIAETSNRLRPIDTQLQEVLNNAVRYGELTTSLEHVEASLRELNARRQESRSQLEHQRQLDSAWDDWINLNEAERQLADLPVIKEFPVNGVTRLESMEQRSEAARKEYETAQGQVDKAKAKAAVEIEHEVILTRADAIRDLERGRTAFDASVRDLPRRETERDAHERSLASALKNLGQGWDESRLEEFDLSIAIREEISKHQKDLREAREEMTRHEYSLTQDEAALEEAMEALSRTGQRLDDAVQPTLDAGQIAERRTGIRTARSHLGQVASRQQHASDLRDQLAGLVSSGVPVSQKGSGRRSVSAIAAAIGIGLVVLGALLSAAALLLGTFAGLSLIGVAVYLYRTGASAPDGDMEPPQATGLRGALQRIEKEQAEFRAELAQDAAVLDLDAEAIAEQSLINVESTLDGEESRLREWAGFSSDREEAQAVGRQREAKRNETKEAVGQAQRHLDTVQGSWQEWLQARGLRATFTPETVAELRGQVELGHSHLDNVRSSRERIQKIKQDIARYIEAVAPLASAFDVPSNRDRSETISAAADSLIELHQNVQEKVRARTAAEDDLVDAERQMDEREKDLRKVEEDMAQLLQSGDASDAEEFRKCAEISARRAKLEEEDRNALDRLRRLSGPGEALEALRVALDDTDRQGIADETYRLGEEISDVESRLDSLSTDRGSRQSELDNLLSEEESSALRMERYHLLEQMRDHAREWVKRTLAEKLLEEARGKFERERQPGVVRHAGSFFRKITDERYQQVFAPLGEQTITVTDADGHPKQPSELSRGTREQLFLSLRFGLIRDSGEQTEPLPVVVDEVLVNFDPERALRAASAFVELSQTNQVLVFTCHPEIVTHFQNAAAMAGAQDPEVVTIG